MQWKKLSFEPRILAELARNPVMSPQKLQMIRAFVANKKKIKYGQKETKTIWK